MCHPPCVPRPREKLPPTTAYFFPNERKNREREPFRGPQASQLTPPVAPREIRIFSLREYHVVSMSHLSNSRHRSDSRRFPRSTILPRPAARRGAR